MRYSRILVSAFLSSALLAACGGNNTLSSAGSFGPSAGSLVPPATTGAQLFQGVAPDSRPSHSSLSPIAPDHTAPDREDGHIITFDDPDAGGNAGSVCNGNPFCGTTPEANNDAGTVAGYYTDSNYVVHSFIRKPSGQIENFDAPGASSMAGQGTVTRSINRFGWVAGAYQDSNGVYHGFVRALHGLFLAPYSDPKAGTGTGQGTQTFDINGRGETAGNYTDSSGVQHGWVCLSNSACKNFDPPSLWTPWLSMLVCEQTCLNADGTVVGYYYMPGYHAHGFARYRDGTIHSIDVRGAGTGKFQGTVVQSINNHGDIAGYYIDSNSIIHGFVLKHQGGPHQELHSFEVPGSKPVQQPCAHGTYAFSINDDDTTTGSFPNSAATAIGYSRSSAGHYSTFEAGGGTAQCQGTWPSTNNNIGDVTGWFTDANNLNHGFIWTPGKLRARG